MFPLFNYGFGFNNRFPNPKPIHAAREGSHIIAEDEPIMSGNDLAAAAVALAASCVIAYFAFRNGKGNKIIKSISGTSPSAPPPSSSTASTLGTLSTGGSGSAAAISHEPVAVASSSHSASHSTSHVSAESVPVGTSSLEHPAAEASSEAVAETAGRTPVVDTPIADTPVEPSIADLGGRPPLVDNAHVDPPSSVPTGDASGVSGAAASSTPPAPSGSLAHPDTPLPSLHKTPAKDLMPLPQQLDETILKQSFIDDKLVSMPLYDGSGKLLGYSRLERNPDGQILRNSIYDSSGKLQEWLEIDYTPNGEIKKIVFNDRTGTYVGDSKDFDIAIKGNPKYSLLNNELSSQLAASKGKPPKASGSGAPPAPPKAPPVPPVPPASPAAARAVRGNSAAVPLRNPAPQISPTSPLPLPPSTPAGAKPAIKLPDLPKKGATPPPASSAAKIADELNIPIADEMLERVFIDAEGKFQSAPVKDADKLIGCSRLIYTEDGRVKTSAFYGTDRKLKDWLEIEYTPGGEIEKVVFHDGQTPITADAANFQRTTKGNPKYALLKKEFARQHDAKELEMMKLGLEAFRAKDYESATAVWRPLADKGNTSVLEYLYEAEFQVGAVACREAIALQRAGNTVEAHALFDKAEASWKNLDKIEDPGKRFNYKGMCHEIMGNDEKAVECFLNGSANKEPQAMINYARHCETGDGMKDGEKDFDQAIKLYQRAGAKEHLERMAKDEQLPPNIRESAEQAKLELEHESKELDESLELAVRPDPAEFSGKLFGTPRPIVSPAPLDLARIEQDGNETYQAALKLFNANDKVAAKEQFARTIGILKPLLDHDPDGRYLTRIGQCLQGMGEHAKAMDYYFAAIKKGNQKAMEYAGIYLETGAGINGGEKDLAGAVEMYIRGGAEKQLQRLSKKTDLPSELRVQVETALGTINSASQPVAVTGLELHNTGAQGTDLVN